MPKPPSSACCTSHTHAPTRPPVHPTMPSTRHLSLTSQLTNTSPAHMQPGFHQSRPPPNVLRSSHYHHNQNTLTSQLKHPPHTCHPCLTNPTLPPTSLVRILYGRILCGRRIFFELQYGTRTVRINRPINTCNQSTVQSYKFEYSTSKRRGLSTVRYRSVVNLQQDKSTGLSEKCVRYATRRVRSMKKRVRYVRVHSSCWPHGGVESYCTPTVRAQ